MNETLKFRVMWPFGGMPIGSIISIAQHDLANIVFRVMGEVKDPKTGATIRSGVTTITALDLVDPAKAIPFDRPDPEPGVAPLNFADVEGENDMLKKTCDEYIRQVVELQRDREQAQKQIEAMRAQLAERAATHAETLKRDTGLDAQAKYLTNGEVIERATVTPADHSNAFSGSDGGPLPTAAHVQDEGSN